MGLGRVDKLLRARSTAIFLLAVLAILVLSFGFFEVYKPNSNSSWSAYLVSIIPNIVGVLVVFLAVGALRVYGLSETHDQIDNIREFLEDHVKNLSAQITVVSRMEDAPWRDFFESEGPVGMVSNFATLPILQGKTALHRNFMTMRNGHVLVFANPDDASVVSQISRTRSELVYANTEATVVKAICESISLLLESLPSSVARDVNSSIPGIRILLSSRAVGFTCYWTSRCAYFSGLQTLDENASPVPRIIAYGDSSVAIREYGKDVVQRLRDDLKEPTLAELLTICAATRSPYQITKIKEKLLR